MCTRIKEALNALPSSLKEAMQEITASSNFSASISPEEVEQLRQVSGFSTSALQMALLPVAASYAQVPISNFNVGAIAYGASGRMYFGANMEFIGVPLNQSVHAEQSAIAHAWVKGETKINEITINYSPCGHCRQFMNELNGADTLVIRLAQDAEKTLHHYLPEAFGPRDLGVTTLLLSPVDHGLNCQHENPLVEAALKAANRSHVPYSNNLSALAIRAKPAQLFWGMPAENAAFNPSLPPLQVALNAMNLADVSFENIQEVVFVESDTPDVSHFKASCDILERLQPKTKIIRVSL